LLKITNVSFTLPNKTSFFLIQMKNSASLS
jgi:hypothetical protein